MSGEWFDSLARSFAGQPGPISSGDSKPGLSRGHVLRRGAAAVLALTAFGRVDTALGASSGATACPGGSRKACYGRIDKQLKKLLTSVCDDAYVGSIVDWGNKFSCYAGFTQARRTARGDCRKKCKAANPPPPPPPPGGNCGGIDCFPGNLCCATPEGPTCCAVGCRKDGKGCCSGSDCG